MLEEILEYERALFLALNGAHTPFGDQFMWLFSGLKTWIPVAVSFLFILFYSNRNRWKEMLLIVVAIALVITLCDQFASSFCKPFFARFRPTYHPDFKEDVKTVFGYIGGRYGFISSHAANGFGFAMLTSLIFRNKFYTFALMTWAAVSAYSRIYLGVHFISDIIPGIVTGLVFGWSVYKLFVFAHKKLPILNSQFSILNSQFSILNSNSLPVRGIKLVTSLLIVTVVLLVIISLLYAGQFIPAIKFK